MASPEEILSAEFEVFGQVQASLLYVVKSDVLVDRSNQAINGYKILLDAYAQLGCNFTKCCKELAEQLGVVGWVKNSKTGTIVGKLQGIKSTFDHMVDWLSTTGSPGCKIEKCELTNFQHVTGTGYADFSIRF